MDKRLILEAYCAEHSSVEPEHLQMLTKRTWQEMANPRMITGHLQGRLLSLYSKLIKPVVAIEIGTFSGYGALCIAEGLANNGRVYSVEIDPENASKAKSMVANMPGSEQIEIVNSDGLDFINALEKPIDFLYIDGEKRSYKAYLESAMLKLRVGGVMLFDNTLWGEKVVDVAADRDTEIMQGFNKLLAKQVNLDVVMLPLRDGLSVCFKTAN